ncbi:MAG TPA: redoxin domain-containing protein [Methylomirabilota bacterium]
MIPQLRDWHARYTRTGLTIVGVHTPEFYWEKPYDKVVEASGKLGLTYPIVQDNDMQIWNRWSVRAWPTLVLVDRRGVVRYRHIGEGEYGETEAMIQRLLGESR